jgi:hypothetical protein
MDISEELKQIKTGLGSHQMVLNNLLNERDEFNKKVHIFIVLNIANTIGEMVEANFFSDYSIDSLNISHKYNDEMFVNFIEFKVFHANLDVIEYAKFSQKNLEPIQKLIELFDDMYDFAYDNISEEFCETTKNLKLEKGVENKLLDLLLSKELKTTLDYSQLKISLENNSNPNKSIKSKL